MSLWPWWCLNLNYKRFFTILFHRFLPSSIWEDITNIGGRSPHFQLHEIRLKISPARRIFTSLLCLKCDETLSLVFYIILTAISLIAQITTVIIAITFPLCQNTALVVAGKLSGTACRLCAICMFVWTVIAVIIKIANKSCRDASRVIARELVGTTTRYRGSCK